VQDVVPCYVRQFLRTKHIAGNSTLLLVSYNRIRAYENVFLVLAEGLYTFKVGVLLLVGGDHMRQLVLYERNFGWLEVWKLNPEVLGSLWLLASSTCGEPLLPKASLLGKSGRVPFEL
jgi:hypothetical protein